MYQHSISGNLKIYKGLLGMYNVSQDPRSMDYCSHMCIVSSLYEKAIESVIIGGLVTETMLEYSEPASIEIEKLSTTNTKQLSPRIAKHSKEIQSMRTMRRMHIVRIWVGSEGD